MKVGLNCRGVNMQCTPAHEGLACQPQLLSQVPQAGMQTRISGLQERGPAGILEG